MRIAIVRLSSLGDVIIATSVLNALKGHQIEWFVDERFEGVIKDSPFIHTIHSLPFKKLLKSPVGILQIRKYCKRCGAFDAVVDMQGLMKSALIGSFIDSKQFVGFDWKGSREGIASLFYSQKIAMAYDENILKRNFALFAPLGVKIDSLDSDVRVCNIGFDADSVQADVKTKICQPIKYRILLVLEASISQKEYPIDKFATLAHLFYNKLQDFCVFVVWNANETRADTFCQKLENLHIPYQKMPKLDLNALKFCVAHMDCVIGGDTGVTHLAWAMGRECITLYGNTSSTCGKNMSATKLERVLLGNPYIVSQSEEFEIASIKESDIFELFMNDIFPRLALNAHKKI
ncbi:lipopolysaccharide heptosyltransferase I [Helicobacter sp. MIT 05-5293]|uniref:lipopolysaccharide heptosyltransferase I n=1 Tax=Helicobacter sp. MIT 05-5293 TaxID=1548149 RepID=UPI00051D2839|nr:lipopolysaccharide heptosyltransferase I [Helicobacter sp. MIT 05-5293]TLD79778.1 lipopolysaccharide heptosyltransferase I [Helicobacter sp. MIT 05-5293]